MKTWKVIATSIFHGNILIIYDSKFLDSISHQGNQDDMFKGEFGYVSI
jgi:hypothetical protein